MNAEDAFSRAEGYIVCRSADFTPGEVFLALQGAQNSKSEDFYLSVLYDRLHYDGQQNRCSEGQTNEKGRCRSDLHLPLIRC